MILHVDRQGRPIEDVLEWAKLIEDKSYHFLKRETLPNGVYVVTIWEGITIPEHLFYTAVFRRGPDSGKGWVKTMLDEIPSETEGQAFATHAETVQKWRDQ